MSRWTFYTAPNTCAFATHIALHEAGADFELVRLDFGRGDQQAPAYLAINPKGRVPALVTEDGALTESPALLAFVAQRFPQAGLAPFDDPFALAKMQEFNSYLASTYHVAHAHGRRGSRWSDDAAAIATMQAKVEANMTACANFIEQHLDGDYVLGSRFSVADCYLYALGGWLEGDGVDVSAVPKIIAHRERMAQRPAVQKATAEQRA